jgi:transposase, IS30 family
MKPYDKNVYDADLAHARARDKARRERAGALVRDPELRDLVRAKLEDTWSPQQIAPGYGPSIPSAVSGTSVTRRSTRRSTWAERAV